MVFILCLENLQSRFEQFSFQTRGILASISCCMLQSRAQRPLSPFSRWQVPGRWLNQVVCLHTRFLLQKKVCVWSFFFFGLFCFNILCEGPELRCWGAKHHWYKRKIVKMLVSNICKKKDKLTLSLEWFNVCVAGDWMVWFLGCHGVIPFLLAVLFLLVTWDNMGAQRRMHS